MRDSFNPESLNTAQFQRIAGAVCKDTPPHPANLPTTHPSTPIKVHILSNIPNEVFTCAPATLIRTFWMSQTCAQRVVGAPWCHDRGAPPPCFGSLRHHPRKWTLFFFSQWHMRTAGRGLRPAARARTAAINRCFLFWFRCWHVGTLHVS